MNSHAAFSVQEVLRASWSITKKYWKQYFVVFAVAAFVFSVLSITTSIATNGNDEGSIVMNVLQYILGAYASIVFTRLALTAVEGKKVALDGIFKADLRTFFASLLAMAVYTIMQMVGFVLLIIPGIIVTVIFQFYIHAIVDKKMPAFAALEHSMKITKGNRFTIFLVGLSLFLIALLYVGVVLGVIFLAYRGSIMGLESGVSLNIPLMVAVAGVTVVASLVFMFLYSSVSLTSLAYIYKKLSK